MGFLGLRERDLALHNGQIGAFRWICWWHDKQDFIGGGCCLKNREIELFPYISGVFFVALYKSPEPKISWNQFHEKNLVLQKNSWGATHQNNKYCN